MTSASKLPAVQGSSAKAGSISSAADAAGDKARLPLRLSVARGGLGIELSRPVHLQGIVVEELEIALTGLSFPVDLSKGVKQFRNRRGSLRRARVSLDLPAVAASWSLLLEDLLGQPLLGSRASVRPSGGAVSRASSAEFAANEQTSFGTVAFCFYGETAALGFDLVLCPGGRPRLIVDRARLVGASGNALALVLMLIDRGAEALSLLGGAVKRHGRALEVHGLARYVAQQTLPTFGCRVPALDDAIVHRAEFERGNVSLILESEVTPCETSARGLRLIGFADLVRAADDRLASGDHDGARAGYLEALEDAPGHPELLLSLAELDCGMPGREESAQVFLDEISPSSPRAVLSLVPWIRSQALGRSHRPELALENLREAALHESEPILAAYVGVHLADQEPSLSRQVEILTQAIQRAPSALSPRWRRFSALLKLDRRQEAATDAEQIEAATSSGPARGAVALRLGQMFGEMGYLNDAVHWLRRALRMLPESQSARLHLAQALSKTGEELRAAELLQVLLRDEAKAEQSADGDESVLADAGRLSRDERDVARLLLAEIARSNLVDYPLALSIVRGVDSRSRHALSARLLEAALGRLMAESSVTRRAHSRLLEAVSLGWIAKDSARDALRRIEREERDGGDSELADFAKRLLDDASARPQELS